MTGLGRRVPPDWEHVDRYPLTASTTPTVPTPVAIGVNWYEEFDRPYKDGSIWRVDAPAAHSKSRGGHCVALKQRHAVDATGWYDFYNQGSEGACVGFGCSRVMSLLNRKRYDARWLWDEAKKVDEWPETNPGDDNGTSVRAGLNVLKRRGHVVWGRGDYPILAEGISAYRWIRSVDDLLAVLGYAGLGYADVVNSWGRGYPHLTRFPAEALERLWKEDGEFGVPTDR
jgi:hypothetical protein